MTALDILCRELTLHFGRIQQRHPSVGYKFDRFYGLMEDAKREATQATQPSPETELYRAAISCSHEIDKEKVVLYFDEKQPGHNALNQLGRRLNAAHAAISAQAAQADDQRGRT